MEIDVNMMRTTDAELHGLPLCDDVMTFYYDEIANCGKLILTNDRVNDEISLECDFILGGVDFDGEHCPADARRLLKDLKLQSFIKELKFKHMTRGRKTFLEFMRNSRVTSYMEWLHNLYTGRDSESEWVCPDEIYKIYPVRYAAECFF